MTGWAGRVGRIRVIGTGVMGRGIVQLAATGGVTVELADVRADAVQAAIEYVSGMLDRLESKGRLTAEQARAAKGRLVPVAAPAAPADGVDLVIEAVREDLETKRALFADLERVCAPETVFATNTSSLSVTEIAAGLADPARMIGLHFFNPVPLMRLVEVVPGVRTHPWLPGEALELVRGWGHEPVLARDAPGFLVNHAGRGLNTEALQILSESVAEPVDVDRIARDVLGLKLGPFELLDLTGLDVSHAVLESIWSGFHSEPRLRPSWLTRPRVAAGLFGRKNGEGFYRYVDGKQEAPAEPAAPPVPDMPVFTSDERLGRLLAAAGVQVVSDAYPDAVLLLTLRGESTVEAAAREGLPADRVCGVDALGAYERRFTLSVHPGLDPAAGRAAWGALAGTGLPVTIVRDGPAPIAQRLLASIVNTACYLADQGLAVPADIDTAVRLGLGYPRGPLEWGDLVGPDKVLRVLTGLAESTGDPRYRPSGWLTERVALGLPLTATGTRPADLH
ncbi:3-hydroxyacyl-CoA dehydrogenase [Amycolatopsis saalfeldensis]|uniref:3-hydroxybutyryl-CoA dehydrogenase n=1 Tax=Amycolatopsis saalfeldensis TaxID=394193 RepID=A0A1H8YLF5_9PSEU|nr:3-hydroxyacyl-CoA dehydrogenase [Amycolatopsis saalfeldensis]SEP52986.1 3-hydroxybutyryl-CoA dehydrogenase [Amycolatopsis saalfeldensis]